MSGPPGQLKNWSAIVLAAGGSRRFGAHKLLVDLAGRPVLVRTVEAVCATGFAETIVVTGSQSDAVTAALTGLPCRLVVASGWEAGLSASIRVGVGSIRQPVEGLFLFLGDMPLVPVELCAELAALAKSAGYAARPQLQSVPSHPVAFLAEARADLLALEGDDGAGPLLRSAGKRVGYLATSDIGATLDVDTPDDLAVAERAWNSRFTSAMIDNAISGGDLPNP